MTTSLHPVELPFRSSRVSVAMVQLAGPAGVKRPSALNGRDTLCWPSMSEVRERLVKAHGILEFLASRRPRADMLVVFPEYSLPLDLPELSKLHDAATHWGQVVIAGADNGPVDGRILNRSAVLVPGHEKVHWVTKRHVSKWEQRYVDEPDVGLSNPFFVWSSGAHTYRIAVTVCMDFLDWQRPEWRLPEPAAPTIYAVPMSSPDTGTFRQSADTLLLEEGGRAVVLANTVDTGTPGESSVFVVTPTGERLEPAIRIWESKESICLFELDCDNLVPAKRPARTSHSALRNQETYDVSLRDGAVIVAPRAPQERKNVTRAIINPYLFELLGKKTRVAFVRIDDYGKLNTAAFKGAHMDAYQALGPHDVMVTHLGQTVESLKFDIGQVLPSTTRRDRSRRLSADEFDGEQDDGDADNPLPYFEVSDFHKVLGQTIRLSDRRIADRPVPDGTELQQLFALAEQWDDPDVPEATRAKFQERRWILGSTQRAPGEINAVMTIYVQRPQDGFVAAERFQDFIAPSLLKYREVTSIWEGVPHKLRAHYLLRIWASKERIFDLIDEVHRRAGENRLVLSTVTYVLGRRWSVMDLRRSLTAPSLFGAEEATRNNLVLPHLSDLERQEYIRRPEEEQRKVNVMLRRFRAHVTPLSDGDSVKEDDVERRLVRGVAFEDIEALREIHDRLQARVEAIVKRIVEEGLTEEEFAGVRESIDLPRQRTIATLTYAERLKVALWLRRNGERNDGAEFEELLRETVPVRNHLAHGRYGEVTLESLERTCERYAGFLSSTAR